MDQSNYSSFERDIDNICFVRCHFTIEGLNRKHRSQSCEITSTFCDKDKLLWELIPNTSPRRFASRLRNAEMPTRFVMQKRRRESSGHSQLWSGTAFPVFRRVFSRWRDGNFRTVKKSVLSARFLWKAGDNKATPYTGVITGTRFGGCLASRFAPGKEDPTRKLCPWIKDITVRLLSQKGKRAS